MNVDEFIMREEEFEELKSELDGSEVSEWFKHSEESSPWKQNPNECWKKVVEIYKQLKAIHIVHNDELFGKIKLTDPKPIIYWIKRSEFNLLLNNNNNNNNSDAIYELAKLLIKKDELNNKKCHVENDEYISFQHLFKSWCFLTIVCKNEHIENYVKRIKDNIKEKDLLFDIALQFIPSLDKTLCRASVNTGNCRLLSSLDEVEIEDFIPQNEYAVTISTESITMKNDVNDVNDVKKRQRTKNEYEKKNRSKYKRRRVVKNEDYEKNVAADVTYVVGSVKSKTKSNKNIHLELKPLYVKKPVYDDFVRILGPSSCDVEQLKHQRKDKNWILKYKRNVNGTSHEFIDFLTKRINGVVTVFTIGLKNNQRKNANDKMEKFYNKHEKDFKILKELCEKFQLDLKEVIEWALFDDGENKQIIQIKLDGEIVYPHTQNNMNTNLSNAQSTNASNSISNSTTIEVNINNSSNE